jgi:hypothetical protein
MRHDVGVRAGVMSRPFDPQRGKATFLVVVQEQPSIRSPRCYPRSSEVWSGSADSERFAPVDLHQGARCDRKTYSGIALPLPLGVSLLHPAFKSLLNPGCFDNCCRAFGVYLGKARAIISCLNLGLYIAISLNASTVPSGFGRDRARFSIRSTLVAQVADEDHLD